MESLKIAYEVVAGLIPNEPEERHTRRFFVNSEDFSLEKMLEAWHQAVAYMTYLQLLCADGKEVNWIRLDFIWL